MTTLISASGTGMLVTFQLFNFLTLITIDIRKNCPVTFLRLLLLHFSSILHTPSMRKWKNLLTIFRKHRC